MSAFAGQPALPDHIEGAHPLLRGEIRFLLFWLAPTSPGVHFTTTTCYCTGLFTRLDCTTLQLSVSLSQLSLVGGLETLKSGHQVEPTSVSPPERWCRNMFAVKKCHEADRSNYKLRKKEKKSKYQIVP